MAPRRPPFPSAWEQSLEDQLIDARATIAELEKRVAAFEKHSEAQAKLIFSLAHDVERNFDALTAERQRREELERELGK